jgi:hypothetical protein
MKVHVVLRKGTDGNGVAEVIRIGKMTGVNEARARRFGIVTGEVLATSVEALRAHPLVESVEIDAVKRAT